jgi:transposase
MVISYNHLICWHLKSVFYERQHVLRIESFDTLYSEVAQTWTPWCRASCLPPTGRSLQQRPAGESPENLSMKNLSLDVGVTGARLHDAHHSPLASSSGHSKWTVVAPG